MNLSGFAFFGGGLDRAAHLRQSEYALDALWPRARVLQLDGESRALDGPDLNDWSIGAALSAERPEDAVFLGLAGDTPCFATEQAGAAGVFNWRHCARFCGACGGEAMSRLAGWSARCRRCGLEAYPRTDPAIIVAVSSGDRLLLGRQASWPTGRWSVLAGFVEAGESLVQAVAREVFEETGVRVRHARYADNQPWPFPSALMVGFFADADLDAADPVLDDQLEAARWFSRDEVRAGLEASDAPASSEPPVSAFAPRLSIARALIEAWLDGRTGGEGPSPR